MTADMSAADRANWADALRAAYAAASAPGESLAPEEVLSIADALLALEDPAARQLPADYVLASTGWEGLSPMALRDLAMHLAKLGPGGADARLRLVDHIGRDRLATPQAIRQMPASFWGDCYDALKGELSPVERAQWAQRIRAACLPTPDAASAMEAVDLGLLVDALTCMGDGAAKDLLAVHFAEDADLSKLSPDGLRYLALKLAKRWYADTAFRNRVCDHVTRTVVDDPQAIRAVPMSCWPEYVELLKRERPVSLRWIAALRQAYAASPQAVAELSVAEATDLTRGLYMLADPDSAQVGQAWLADRDLADLSIEEASRLLSFANPDETLRLRFEERCLAREQAGTLSLHEYERICVAWWFLHEQQRLEKWAMLAYRFALGADASAAKSGPGSPGGAAAQAAWADLAAMDKVAGLLARAKLTEGDEPA